MSGDDPNDRPQESRAPTSKVLPKSATKASVDPSQDHYTAEWKRVESRFDAYYSLDPRLTWALVASFVVFHALTGRFDRLRGVPFWFSVFGNRSDEALSALGGREKVKVAAGEWWRLLASGFLHGDAFHLFFNATALLSVGRLGEVVFGPAQMAWIFLLSVLGGSLLSQAGPVPLSIGASGGVFGVLGALGTFGLRRRHALSPPLGDAFGRKLWPWIIGNLLLGWLIPSIDQRAHVGGLLTGMFLGAILGDRLTDAGYPSPWVTRGLGAAAALLVAWAWGSLLLA